VMRQGARSFELAFPASMNALRPEQESVGGPRASRAYPIEPRHRPLA
jgi:hypothetical protein